MAISQPFTAVMSLSCAVQLDRCHHCMAACFPQTYWQHSEEFRTYPLMSSPSVCSHCCNVIYCSKTCRDKAWKTYHQFECGQLDILHKLTFPPYNLHLALRALYSTGSLAVNQLVAKASAEMKDPLQLEDPVDYGHIYRMAFIESETGFADQCTFQLTQCILACLLTKLAEQSKFVQVRAVLNVSLSDNTRVYDKLYPNRTLLIDFSRPLHSCVICCNTWRVSALIQSNGYHLSMKWTKEKVVPANIPLLVFSPSLTQLSLSYRILAHPT